MANQRGAHLAPLNNVRILTKSFQCLGGQIRVFQQAEGEVFGEGRISGGAGQSLRVRTVYSFLQRN
jgi:hypothetical protein